MAYYRHTTQSGERWDAIAYQYYGDPYDYVGIIQANPALQNQWSLPSGIVLNIPIKDIRDQQPNIKPPWK